MQPEIGLRMQVGGNVPRECRVWFRIHLCSLVVFCIKKRCTVILHDVLYFKCCDCARSTHRRQFLYRAALLGVAFALPENYQLEGLLILWGSVLVALRVSFAPRSQDRGALLTADEKRESGVKSLQIALDVLEAVAS